MIIGISGYARSGKDTFGLSLQRTLREHNIETEINAFAYALKKDIEEFIFEKFRISSFTKDDQEKFLIRPMLVAYGESKRNQNPNYWIEQIKKNFTNKLIIITDVRYENEAKWILEENGILIHINRRKNDGTYIEAPNPQEAKNAPIVKKLADYNFYWDTIEESNGLIDQKKVDEIVKNFLHKEILNKIINGK